MLPLAVVLVWTISITFYFLPAVIAAWRGHHNKGAIFLLDLLLGWTFIGWVCALVWAFTQVYPRVRAMPPAWSAENDEIQWSAHARGERTPSRW